MRVGLVGKGRAGSTLAQSLRHVGLAPSFWWSRRDGTDVGALPPVDVVLLAVSDSAIEVPAPSTREGVNAYLSQRDIARGHGGGRDERPPTDTALACAGAAKDVAGQLAGRGSAREEVWLHLSGSRPGSVCRTGPGVPLAAAALHPLQALPGQSAGPGHLVGVMAGVDGEERGVEAALQIASALGMKPRRLESEDKPLYHAAAVTAAGHVTSLFHQALGMLQVCGFTRGEAHEALHPLLAGAVGNMAGGAGPEDVITGPVARGDAATVAGHVRELEGRAPGRTAETYRLLALTALEISAPHLDERAREELARILRGEEGSKIE